MFEGNKSFEAFRDRLEAKGVFLRCMWEANSGVERRDNRKPPVGSTHRERPLGKGRPDVALYAFYGERTEIGTAVLVDYGEDGLGIWPESRTNSIDDDVSYIIEGGTKPAAPALSDRELAAVLAGLRMLETAAEEHTLDDDIEDILTNGDAFEPLDPDEIEALCERLNTKLKEGT